MDSLNNRTCSHHEALMLGRMEKVQVPVWKAELLVQQRMQQVVFVVNV